MKKRMSKQKKLVIALALANGINVFAQTAYAATVLNAGEEEVVRAREVITNTVVNDGGIQRVNGDSLYEGKAVGSIVNNGGLQDVYGGITEDTIINEGGKQTVRDGNSWRTTILGLQELYDYDWYSTIKAGGTQNIGYKGNTWKTKIEFGGTQEVLSGGIAKGAEIYGVQNISRGGEAQICYVYAGGVQNVNYAALASGLHIYGGIQNVNRGGVATNIRIYEGGIQNINDGGRAKNVIIDLGGTSKVKNNGVIVDATIYGNAIKKGELQMQETAAVQGTTTLNGGAISLVGNLGNYQIDKLVANGGTVNLAKGETLGRNLNFDSVSGSTNFRINTDLINKKADYITIKSADAPAEHTVQVNYDPTFENGKSFVGSTPFATVPTGTSFKGLNSEYGAYVFEPTLASRTGVDSTVWSIEKFKLHGEPENPTPSESVKTAADLVHSSLLLGRVHNNNLVKRMGDLRQAHGEAGVWTRMYTGEQEIANDGTRDTKQKFTALQAGYDQRIVKDDGVWYVGGALGYLNGKSTFERGNGTSKDMAVAAYGSWMGNKGHFLDVIAKVGRLDNEFTSYLNNSNNTMVSGNYKNWGRNLTVEYGYKQQLANDFYVEPQAEMSLNKVSSANFILSDGTNAKIPSISSLVGRLGVAVGKKVGDTNYYGKVSVLKEFKADGAVSMQNGDLPTASFKQNLQENWVEYAVGATTVLNKKTNGYLELTRTAGDKVRTPWQVNIGARWNF